MSLIQGGQLQLKKKDDAAPPAASSPAAPARKPLPYLGAVGTIPLSVSTGSIHHHPGSTPSAPKAA